MTNRARVLFKRPARSAPLGQPLTQREAEILALVSEGMSNKAVAAQLKISAQTVKFHLGHAVKKMGTSSRTRAAVQFSLQGDAWTSGFVTALAMISSEGCPTPAICKVARSAGLTVDRARQARASSRDIDALKSAGIP